MVDVPNLPGVPALNGYSIQDMPLLQADNLIAIAALLVPVWGVFLDGVPVIAPASLLPRSVTNAIASGLNSIATVAALVGVPNIIPCVASMVEFDYTADSPISNYPQENGAFQSYNKVQLPFDIRLKLASNYRQAFLGTLNGLRSSTVLVDVVTPDITYRSCNCKHVDYKRTANNGVDLIIADVWFEQVRVTAQSLFSNTQQSSGVNGMASAGASATLNPGDAGTQAIGNVQPQAPSSGLQQQVGNGPLRITVTPSS